MGNSNILAKVFVDEALTCSKPIEAHIYDVELAMENPLPCFYCGEREIEKISFPMTEEKFPLCKRCQECGRGAAPRRKSRKLIPKTLKIPEKKISKVKKIVLFYKFAFEVQMFIIKPFYFLLLLT